MNKQEMQELGRELARDGRRPPYDRDGKSWQARACWEAFNEEKRRLEVAPPVVHDRGAAPEGWPVAAWAHSAFLAKELSKPQPFKRAMRLAASLRRLAMRHGKPFALDSQTK